jgi:hypothetical protein
MDAIQGRNKQCPPCSGTRTKKKTVIDRGSTLRAVANVRSTPPDELRSVPTTKSTGHGRTTKKRGAEHKKAFSVTRFFATKAVGVKRISTKARQIVADCAAVERVCAKSDVHG